jgi:type VI secretion system protein ImpE
MNAYDLFSAGRLRDAIEAQTSEVHKSARDSAARLFLFELLVFAGDLDGSRHHLDRLRADEPRHAGAIQQLRDALDAEEHRRAVFAGTRAPRCLGAAPDHLLLRLEALKYLASGEHAEAGRRFDEANATAPAAAGALNAVTYSGLADADERFGTVLEVFGPGGAYSWVPLEQVESVTMHPPRSRSDVLWRPAHVALVGGPRSKVLLPGLYPGTHENPDDEVRLGRVTEWIGADGQLARGVGGRVFITGDAVTRFADVTSLRRTALSR